MYSKLSYLLLTSIITGLIFISFSSVKGNVSYSLKNEFILTDTLPEGSGKAKVMPSKEMSVPPSPPATPSNPAPPAPVPISSLSDALTKVENMPRFYDEGCESFQEIKQKENCARRKFLEYLFENVKYPSQIRRDSMIGDDIVVSRFVVTSKGKIKDIEIIKQPHPAFGNAVEKVLLSLNERDGMWIPGQHQGKAVDVLYTMPVRFKKE